MKNEKIKKFFASRAVRSLSVLLVVVLIGALVYVNYRLFYDPTDAMGFGENNMPSDSTQTGTNPSGEQDYFTATALNRQQSRDEAIDVLKLITEDDEASAEARAEAAEMISKIAIDIQNEANIETLVKAKGFTDCVAVISENAVSVVVSAEELQAAEAAQILAIVYDTTGISPDKVSIINK